MKRSSMAKSKRAEKNSAYVRRLLRERQPEFAAALAAVEIQLLASWRPRQTGSG
jgi:hypothetical protein